MKHGRRRRTDAVHQHEPDQRRPNAGNDHGVGKRHTQLPRPSDIERFKRKRWHPKHRAADQHLQTNDHQKITARRRATHRQRRHCQRHDTDNTKAQTEHIDLPLQTCTHDQRHSNHTRDQTCDAKGPDPFAKYRPAREGDQQRHRRRDDRCKRRFDGLHCHKIQPQIERILRHTKDQRGNPLAPRQMPALAHDTRQQNGKNP